MKYSSLLKHALLLSAFLLVASPVVQASNNGADTAANAVYSGGTWNNGTNGGTGFQAWSLGTSGSGSSGFYTGDSTPITGGGTANINTSGVSFGMFASPSGTYADADRYFAGGALTVGQTFSITLQVNYRDGNKGIDLYASGSNAFNLNIGSDLYVVNSVVGGPISLYGGTYSSSTIFTLSFLQTSGSSGAWSVTRSGDPGLTGADTGLVSGTYNGDLDQFHLYNGTSSGGSPSDLAVNSMSIVPEPSSLSLILMSIGLGSAFLARWKRI